MCAKFGQTLYWAPQLDNVPEYWTLHDWHLVTAYDKGHYQCPVALHKRAASLSPSSFEDNTTI